VTREGIEWRNTVKKSMRWTDGSTLREVQALAEIRGFGDDRQYSSLTLSGKLEQLETKVYDGEVEAFQARLANVRAAAAQG
jgi:hypothetical protein